ncbi:MAG TPA: rhodanese-like domain-containing protein [Bacteroidota bacterium]
MKSTLVVAFFCFITLSFAIPASSQNQPSIIVSTEWLTHHVNDPDLVILHVAGTRRDYLNGHVPGARFLWMGWFAQSNPDMSYELVSLDQLTETVRDLGIEESSTIVVCFPNNWVSAGARMFLTLDYLGLGDRTSFLDGGFEAWKTEGRPVSKENPKIQRTSFSPTVNKNIVVAVNAVKAASRDSRTTVIDARSDRYYQGDPGGMTRGGHIPGAVNIAFSSVVDSTNRFLSHGELKDMFEKAGVASGNKVITYCHIGQQASLLYLVARYLGHEASLYDGSFEDWSSKEELPVEVPETKKNQ